MKHVYLRQDLLNQKHEQNQATSLVANVDDIKPPALINDTDTDVQINPNHDPIKLENDDIAPPQIVNEEENVIIPPVAPIKEEKKEIVKKQFYGAEDDDESFELTQDESDSDFSDEDYGVKRKSKPKKNPYEQYFIEPRKSSRERTATNRFNDFVENTEENGEDESDSSDSSSDDDFDLHPKSYTCKTKGGRRRRKQRN